MKGVRWTFGTIVGIFVIFWVVFALSTRPLISSDKAMATAKQQLRFMGYYPPYTNLYMGTGLEWYNHGKLLSAEHVYVTTIAFQSKPGSVVNVQVVEDARTGNIVSVYDFGKPYGKPLF